MDKLIISKLRLLLCVPNYQWCLDDKRTLWHIIPYNLCLLAQMVHDLCDVKIIDAYTQNMTSDQFTKTIKEHRPDIVGLTVSMDQFADSGHMAANLIKLISSEITVIIGGVYATVNPELAIKDKNIDYVIIGEGEYVLRELLLHIKGEAPLPSKGLSYKANGEIINLGRAKLIQNLDNIPLPAYDLIDYASYSNSAPRKSVDSPPLLPCARVITSRGCPQRCIFCQVERISGRKFRARSADNVLKEIAWLKKTYNIRSLIFDDDNLFADRRRAVALFEGMIKRELVMPWKSIATAVFRLDEQLIELMRESGCTYICIAIESGSKRVLNDIIRKPVKYEHARKMVSLAQQHKIFVAANFIIGFPTETWEEIRETIKFAENLKADYVKIFNAIPLRHTRLWDLCIEQKAFKNGFDWNVISWNTGQIETQNFSANDLSILRAYEWDRINFSSPEKRTRIAEIMHINDDQLKIIRKETLASSLRTICESTS